MVDYRDLVQNWHRKATSSAKAKDYFAAFTFEYLAFIACLKTLLHPPNGAEKYSDRSAIQKLKQNQRVKQQYLHTVANNEELAGVWRTIQTELNTNARLGTNPNNPYITEEVKWWNCADDALPNEALTVRGIPGIINGLDDWENMIEFIYTVRNNLFHGTKHPQVDRDLLVVENGYKALFPAVQIMLIVSKP